MGGIVGLQLHSVDDPVMPAPAYNVMWSDPACVRYGIGPLPVWPEGSNMTMPAMGGYSTGIYTKFRANYVLAAPPPPAWVGRCKLWRLYWSYVFSEYFQDHPTIQNTLIQVNDHKPSCSYPGIRQMWFGYVEGPLGQLYAAGLHMDPTCVDELKSEKINLQTDYGINLSMQLAYKMNYTWANRVNPAALPAVAPAVMDARWWQPEGTLVLPAFLRGHPQYYQEMKVNKRMDPEILERVRRELKNYIREKATLPRGASSAGEFESIPDWYQREIWVSGTGKGVNRAHRQNPNSQPYEPRRSRPPRVREAKAPEEVKTAHTEEEGKGQGDRGARRGRGSQRGRGNRGRRGARRGASQQQ